MPRFRVDTDSSSGEVPGWLTIRPVSEPRETRSNELAASERVIAEVLQCDHVVVLAGLGTSLCIKNRTAENESLFPTMSGLWNRVADKVGDATFTEVQRAVGFVGRQNIEELLSRCTMKLVLESSAAEADYAAAHPGPSIDGFVKAAEEVIRSACRKFLDPSATAVHEDFLRRLVRREPRRPRVNLFTTNYDLCFETAAARIGLPIIDGFAFSMPPRFEPEVFDYDVVTASSYSSEPDFVPRLLRLFKLHGSVDWHRQDGFIIKTTESDSPILIYPQSGKYADSYSPPFLEVMSRFQRVLRQRNLGVLSVGCGFNDSHIAAPVLAAVKANPGLRLVVCAPDLCAVDANKIGSPTATTANDTLRQIDYLIENGDSRLTLLNGYFPDLVRLMPMLAVQTDSEQHEQRIKRLEMDMAGLKAGSRRSE